jgi:hypothetical protein
VEFAVEGSQNEEAQPKFQPSTFHEQILDVSRFVVSLSQSAGAFAADGPGCFA